jgi:hypothetical protein
LIEVDVLDSLGRGGIVQFESDALSTLIFGWVCGRSYYVVADQVMMLKNVWILRVGEI